MEVNLSSFPQEIIQLIARRIRKRRDLFAFGLTAKAVHTAIDKDDLIWARWICQDYPHIDFDQSSAKVPSKTVFYRLKHPLVVFTLEPYKHKITVDLQLPIKKIFTDDFKHLYVLTWAGEAYIWDLSKINKRYELQQANETLICDPGLREKFGLAELSTPTCPIRDMAFYHQGLWILRRSGELDVEVQNIRDTPIDELPFVKKSLRRIAHLLPTVCQREYTVTMNHESRILVGSAPNKSHFYTTPFSKDILENIDLRSAIVAGRKEPHIYLQVNERTILTTTLRKKLRPSAQRQLKFPPSHETIISEHPVKLIAVGVDCVVLQRQDSFCIIQPGKHDTQEPVWISGTLQGYSKTDKGEDYYAGASGNQPAAMLSFLIRDGDRMYESHVFTGVPVAEGEVDNFTRIGTFPLTCISYAVPVESLDGVDVISGDTMDAAFDLDFQQEGSQWVCLAVMKDELFRAAK